MLDLDLAQAATVASGITMTTKRSNPAAHLRQTGPGKQARRKVKLQQAQNPSNIFPSSKSLLFFTKPHDYEING